MNKTWYRARLGWLPDYPDFRDYTLNDGQIQALLQKTNHIRLAEKPEFARAVDLREWCPSVEDQGTIGSCTANAAVGLVEYFERRSFGKYIDASRLFLYKTTRNLLQRISDRLVVDSKKRVGGCGRVRGRWRINSE